MPKTNHHTLSLSSIFFLLLLCSFPTLHAQQLAVKTNGLMLAAMAPNIGCNKAKMIGLLPEYRYWFNGRPMTREFVGIAALGVSYDITWGDRIYQGDAAGAGITFGYALNLSRRLNVEFYGGFGAVYFKQKQYYKNDNIEDYTDGTAQANANGYKLLPIKIGVSISYIFK